MIAAERQPTTKVATSKSCFIRDKGFVRWPSTILFLACFGLLCAPPEKGLAQSLNSGNAVTASISTIGETRTYTLYATPGEAVYVSLVNLGGSSPDYQPVLQVYEPTTGSAIWSFDMGAGTINGQGATWRFTANRNGTYSVVVWDYYGSYTGDYRVEIRRIPAAVPITQYGTTTNLNSGQAVERRMNLVGHVEYLTFSATQGETVYVSLVNLGGNSTYYNPMLQVYEPATGSAIWSFDMGAGTVSGEGATWRFNTSLDGAYSVVVWDYYGSYTGDYRIEIRRVPAAVPITQYGPTTNLSNGQAVARTLNPAGHIEYLNFSALSGDTVYLSFVNLGGNNSDYNPLLQVYEPATGSAVWSFDMGAGTLSGEGVTNQFTANLDGNYSVVVWEYNGKYTGSYRIMVSGATPGPVITANPQSRTNEVGTSATFTITAIGAEPMGYQWHFNGTSLTGANGTSYTINSVQWADAGTYTVVVTNLTGNVTSAPAVLTIPVQLPPRPLRLLSATASNVLLQSLGYVGETIVIEWSADLVGWFNTGLSNGCTSNGFYNMTLPRTNHAPAVFYRSRITWAQ